ncbi:FliH/SctL family protein [Aurantiacibacter xanthus]|nr:FliH/SctL family protein [Aurantiacibacter xanthus]
MATKTMSSRALLALAPAGFSTDNRFGRGAPPPVEQVLPEAPGPDPLEEAFARGAEEGEVRARAEYELRLAELEARYAGLGCELAEQAIDEGERLRSMLRETVVALCEQAVAPFALDHELLARRVEKASAMLMRAADERRIRLNPADKEAIAHLVAPGLVLEDDPSVMPGCIRIETADGGIEDGPMSWADAIREAVGQC